MADDRLGGRRVPRNTTGRVPYVWVEDTDTGHRYDVPETALRDGMKPVEGVELNHGAKPRRTKYRTDLAGNDATRTAATDADTPDTGEPTITKAEQTATTTKGARR